MKTSENPSIVKVSLFLCLASIGFALISIVLEYFIGKELPGTSSLSTILPAFATGLFFGNKSGKLMPSKTRWCALLVWLVISLFYVFIIMLILNISPYDLMVEFGWLTLIFLAILVLVFVLSYYVMKSGEKMGVKSFLKKQGMDEA